jgi:hypothetical protein
VNATQRSINNGSYFVVLMYNVHTVQTRNGQFVPLHNTIMARGLLSCEIAPLLLSSTTSSSTTSSNTTTSASWLTIATSHLESFANKQSYTEVRKAQLQYSTRLLTSNLKKLSSCTSAFLLGDLNWKDTERKQLKRSVKITENDGIALESCPDGWHDAWLDTQDDPGYTLDGKTNGMLTYSFQTRLDRCLLCTAESVNQKKSGGGGEGGSAKSKVTVRSTRLIGTERIVPRIREKKETKWKTYDIDVFPSDHYGLLVDISI